LSLLCVGSPSEASPDFFHCGSLHDLPERT
jgi:hypothetical protein